MDNRVVVTSPSIFDNVANGLYGSVGLFFDDDDDHVFGGSDLDSRHFVTFASTPFWPGYRRGNPSALGTANSFGWNGDLECHLGGLSLGIGFLRWY